MSHTGGAAVHTNTMPKLQKVFLFVVCIGVLVAAIPAAILMALPITLGLAGIACAYVAVVGILTTSTQAATSRHDQGDSLHQAAKVGSTSTSSDKTTSASSPNMPTIKGGVVYPAGEIEPTQSSTKEATSHYNIQANSTSALALRKAAIGGSTRVSLSSSLPKSTSALPSPNTASSQPQVPESPSSHVTSQGTISPSVLLKSPAAHLSVPIAAAAATGTDVAAAVVAPRSASLHATTAAAPGDAAPGSKSTLYIDSGSGSPLVRPNSSEPAAPTTRHTQLSLKLPPSPPLKAPGALDAALPRHPIAVEASTVPMRPMSAAVAMTARHPASAAEPAAEAVPKVAAAPVTGGAAILARMRAQRAGAKTTDAAAVAGSRADGAVPAGSDARVASAAVPAMSAAAKPPTVHFLYGSQTGTAQEIAKNLYAEALQRGIAAECLSLSSMPVADLGPAKTPVVVIVASSTGDGDPPDNAALAYASIRKTAAAGTLTGVQFTLLGLGDSNYTRFMAVPRVFKNRFLELGASLFYPAVEADEVDGIEAKVDPWLEGIWEPLEKALAKAVEQSETPAAAPATSVVGPAHQEPVSAIPAAEAVLTAPALLPAALEVATAAAAEPVSPTSFPSSSTSAVLASPAGHSSPNTDEPLSAVSATNTLTAAASTADVAVAGTGTAEHLSPNHVAASNSTAAIPVAHVGEGAASALPLSADDAGPAVVHQEAHTAAVYGTRTLAPTGTDIQQSTTSSPLLPTVEESGSIVDRGLQALSSDSTAVISGVGPIASSHHLTGGSFHQLGSDAAMRLVGSAGESGGGSLARPKTSQQDAPSSRAGLGSRAGLEGSDANAKSLARIRMAKPTNVLYSKGEEAAVPRKDEMTYGFNGTGLVSVGADMRGVPALQPLRLKVNPERDEAVAKQIRTAEMVRPSEAQLAVRDPEGLYSAQRPFWASITDARYETASWSDRKVVHLELDLTGSGITYQPGDSLGILPANGYDIVARVLKRLGRSPSEVITLSTSSTEVPQHLASPATLSYIFTYCVDLTTTPKKSLLRVLAEHCSDSADKRTLMFLTARAGKEAYTHEIMEHQPSLLDLLIRFESCRPPLDALLDALLPLQPRLYSITSAPQCCPGRAQVALSVVRFRTRYGSRLGLASNWIDRLAAPWTQQEDPPAEPVRVGIFLRRSADFKPPVDPLTPAVLVGPGTGVAPFRGFLQQRRIQLAQLPQDAMQARGDWLLFFGCRRDDEDYLYRSDLEAFAADGTLADLDIAFSRTQAEKVYVQHHLRDQGARVADLIVNQNASVYVCGDGGGMARDVHAALRELLKQHYVLHGLSSNGSSAADNMEHSGIGIAEVAADAMLASLIKGRRYIRDIWS